LNKNDEMRKLDLKEKEQINSNFRELR